MESIIYSGYSKAEKVANNKMGEVIKCPRLLALSILRNLFKILVYHHLYIYYIIGFSLPLCVVPYSNYIEHCVTGQHHK